MVGEVAPLPQNVPVKSAANFIFRDGLEYGGGDNQPAKRKFHHRGKNHKTSLLVRDFL
jgi:hypothetical protein